MLDPTTIQRGEPHRDPALLPPDRQRDGHRRRHEVQERRPPRRHAAHRRQQARLHAPDGRGERVHDPAELGGRRVRPQRGRHRDRDHEVGHERREGVGLLLRPRLQPQRDERPGDPQAQRQPLLERRGDDRRADQEEQGLPLRRLRRYQRHAVPGQQLLAPDRAGAPGRLLAVLQRQRHAARHLRPPDLADRQRRAGARPVPGEQDPRRSLGPRGRADPGRAVDAQQRRRRPHRLQQLHGPGRADLPLPQLLHPPRLEHLRPLEGLRPRQPHEDRPGRRRLHGRERPAEAAQHHRVEAQRLEHRRRHGLHVQPLDDAQPPRVLLSGRGQARVPRHGRGRGGLREPVAERLVAAVRRGPPAHLLALPRRGEHGPEPVRGGELLVPAAQGLQRPRAAQQVLFPALDQGRHRDPLEARRRGTLLLLRPALRGGRDGQQVDEPEHDHREPLGELPARRDGPRHLERAVPAAAGRQHGVLRLLRPGRLEDHP